jgi:hypothetical protein
MKLTHQNKLRLSFFSRPLSSALVVLGFVGCTTLPPVDYTAFKQAKPASLLVLPPINDSKDIKATPAVMAAATLPLAQAGYYVMPVALVQETFRQNGLSTPTDIHAVSAAKLREIFDADAAVYLKVSDYGSSYKIVGSETRVSVEGKIIDLRSGALLWSGTASASSNENNTQNQGGLLGLLVQAVVAQVASNLTDASFDYAQTANQRLFGGPRGVLSGPRLPVDKK